MVLWVGVVAATIERRFGGNRNYTVFFPLFCTARSPIDLMRIDVFFRRPNNDEARAVLMVWLDRTQRTEAELDDGVTTNDRSIEDEERGRRGRTRARSKWAIRPITSSNFPRDHQKEITFKDLKKRFFDAFLTLF